MTKSTRAITQIGLALLLAVVAGAMIFKWSANVANRPAPKAAVETVPVVVAKIDLKRGTKLTEEMMDIRKFTPESRPSGTVPAPDKIMGRVLNTDISMNEAVTMTKLAGEDVIGGGVSALIEPGMRAMSVKGNEVMGLAGFVRPGDRVDVLVSMTVGRDDNPVTKLVLERVKILATGTQLTPPNEEGKTASVDVYTLELTPKQSELLALAATRGTLNFALRNEQDEEKILTTGATVPSTLAALRPKPKPRRKSSTVRVEVITGGDRKSVKF